MGVGLRGYKQRSWRLLWSEDASSEQLWAVQIWCQLGLVEANWYSIPWVPRANEFVHLRPWLAYRRQVHSRHEVEWVFILFELVVLPIDRILLKLSMVGPESRIIQFLLRPWPQNFNKRLIFGLGPSSWVPDVFICATQLWYLEFGFNLV